MCLILVLFPLHVGATDLTIGTRAEPAVDPHFLFVATNIAYSRHLFDALLGTDENAQPVPGLAVSWRPVADKIWEFKLREGIKFHDGSDFTADDVVFSINRVTAIPNNPNPYTPLVRTIETVEAIDPSTVRIKTKTIDPVLPKSLSSIFIVSRKAAKDALPPDFRSGKAAIGTGPYQFVSYAPGDRLILKRNDSYWGDPQPWEKVTFRVMSNNASRIAALRSGDISVVGAIAPNDVAVLKRDPDINLFKRPSDRVIYIILDVGRDRSPYVTDMKGNTMDQNPLKDVRVRKALSLAINRKAIVSAVMEGLAEPAGQLVPKGIKGHNPSVDESAFDLEQAKSLMAQAGWEKGFGLTLHGPNNRYVNDARVLETIGQMWARLGLKIDVVTEPMNVYFPKIKVATGVKYSVMLMGWGYSGVGEATHGYNTWLHTYDAKRKYGPANRSGYSNPAFDQLIEAAAVTVDDQERDKKLQKATAMVTSQFVNIPIHFQYTTVAARKGITVTPRIDEAVLAMSTKPSK
jgi:peptide/nickel transport system substrate-binding protein